MGNHELMDALRDVRFLHGVADEHLVELAKIAKLVSFKSNEIIFREGEVAAKAYLVMSGRVSLQICAPSVGCRNILTLGPGEILAWSAVLDQTLLTATARAVESATLVEVHAGLLHGLCDHDPRFGYEFMRRTALALAKRLNATRLQLLDVYGAPAITEKHSAAGD